MKEFKKPLNHKFDVGELCVVMYTGFRYPSYDDMAKALGIYDIWSGLSDPYEVGKDGDVVEILNFALHEKYNIILYAVKPVKPYSDKAFIIEERGLIFHSYPPFFDEGEFKL